MTMDEKETIDTLILSDSKVREMEAQGVRKVLNDGMCHSCPVKGMGFRDVAETGEVNHES